MCNTSYCVLPFAAKSFNSLDNLRAITPDARLTETSTQEPETACNSLSATAARSDSFSSDCVSPLPRHLASHTQVSMKSGTRGLEDRSTSGGISSTNHLTPLLGTRGSGVLFGTLWRSLTSSTSASCNRLRISANLKFLRTSTSSKSCDETYTSRPPVIRSTRDDSSGPNAATVQARSRTFQTRPYVQPGLCHHVRVRSGFLSGCGGIGPSTAFLANQAPVYCGCPAGTHGCDLVSKVRLDQSANPVVVWLGLVSRVVRSSSEPSEFFFVH